MTDDVSEEESERSGVELAHTELKRAYLHLDWGQFEEAYEACQKAAEFAPDHYLPPTLEGAILIAEGKVKDALGKLRKVTKRHRDEPLPMLYFAEACFFAGRIKQGRRKLKKAEKLEGAEEHADFIDGLHEAWDDVDPDEIPPPLVVPPADEIMDD